MRRERVDPAANLRPAFEMFEVGVAMMREKLLRKSPNATAEAIARQLDRWLLKADEPLSLGSAEHQPICRCEKTKL